MLGIITSGLGVLGDLASDVTNTRAANRTSGMIRDMLREDPYQIQGLGMGMQTDGKNASVNLSPAMQQMYGNLYGIQQSGAQGGQMFLNPAFQQAFQGLDIAGPMSAQDAALQNTIMPTAYNQGGMDAAMGQLGGMLGYAGNQFQQGPQDYTGLQGNFMNQMQGMMGGGDFNGLFNQYLDQQRAAAEPFETRMANSVANKLFGSGRGATTGGRTNELFNLNTALSTADQNRQNAAMGFAQQDMFNRWNAAQGFGGLAQNMAGQNLNVWSNLGQIGQGLGTAYGGLEDTMFQNMLSGQNANLSRGQQRITNALGLFDTGRDTYQQGMDQMFKSTDSALSIDRQILDYLMRPLEADASRIGAQAQGFAGLQSSGQAAGQAQGGLLGGVMKGLGSIFSDIRLKDDLRYENGEWHWSWNEIGTAMGLGDQPTHGEIAQIVQLTEPERVFVDPETGYLKIEVRNGD